MNKYIVPIAEFNSGDIYILKINAKSLKDCEDKVISEIIDIYDSTEQYANESYIDFVKDIDTNEDILVGEIIDIETL